jgi:replicative superfamily II helicase
MDDLTFNAGSLVWGWMEDDEANVIITGPTGDGKVLIRLLC